MGLTASLTLRSFLLVLNTCSVWRGEGGNVTVSVTCFSNLPYFYSDILPLKWWLLHTKWFQWRHYISGCSQWSSRMCYDSCSKINVFFSSHLQERSVHRCTYAHACSMKSRKNIFFLFPKSIFVIKSVGLINLLHYNIYSLLSLNGHLYKTNTSVKQTLRVGPSLSLHPLFDPL